MRRRAGLFAQLSFRRVWLADTVSLAGSEVSALAIPLAAALTLHASALQLGLLTAAGLAPNLLVALPAGVWLDRCAQLRPVLVAADVGRALVLGSIPLAALAGVLGMAQLLVVATLAGSLTVVFNIGHTSFLPGILRRDELVAGNAHLKASMSLAQLTGPGVAGALVQLAGAPFAVALDALSFLVSAALLRGVQARERCVAARVGALRGQLAEGLRLVLSDPSQRAISASAATLNFFGLLVLSIFVLYATRDLHLGAGEVGLVFVAGGLGALVGAVLAPALSRRFGQGRVIVGATAWFTLALGVVPLAQGPPALALAILMTGECLSGAAVMLFDVNVAALRQTLTPPHLLSRTSSAMTFVTQGAKPLGALAGGVLGDLLGLRPALWVAALGGLGCVAWTWFSPLRHDGGAH